MRRHPWTELARVESAGNEQHRVANRLGRQSPNTHSMQQPVGRINGRDPLGIAVRHWRRCPGDTFGTKQFVRIVCLRDQPLEMKSCGKPIKQLRMAGRFALRAEVVHGRYNPTTQQMVPETIDDHSRGQRVIGTGNQIGQFEARSRLATARASRNLAGTFSPRFRWLPRMYTCASSGVPSAMATANRGAGSCSARVAASESDSDAVRAEFLDPRASPAFTIQPMNRIGTTLTQVSHADLPKCIHHQCAGFDSELVRDHVLRRRTIRKANFVDRDRLVAIVDELEVRFVTRVLLQVAPQTLPYPLPFRCRSVCR